MLGNKDQNVRFTPEELRAIIRMTLSAKAFFPNFFITAKKEWILSLPVSYQHPVFQSFIPSFHLLFLVL